MTISTLTRFRQETSALAHATALINRRSITPADSGCQAYIRQRLERLGFDCESFEVNGVSNLIARIGSGQHHIGFSGHTDVVNPGDLSRWSSEPFTASIRENRLYGRGAADMKTGIAAMLSACERFNWQKLDQRHSFWWLITSDEEGEAEWGSREIQARLAAQGVSLDALVVGEPTAASKTGDCIKVGRRGSLSGRISIRGKQGHVAYPQQSVNAASLAAEVVTRLDGLSFKPGSVDFPGTTLQVTKIDTGHYSDNIVPGQAEVCFNVRYADDVTEQTLKTRIERLVDEVCFDYQLEWERPCTSYLSQPRHTSQCLIRAIEMSIFSVTGRYPILSTAGGTSDGRFFASADTQVVEVGVPNNTIHQVNESIAIEDLAVLESIYTDLLKRVLL